MTSPGLGIEPGDFLISGSYFIHVYWRLPGRIASRNNDMGRKYLRKVEINE